MDTIKAFKPAKIVREKKSEQGIEVTCRSDNCAEGKEKVRFGGRASNKHGRVARRGAEFPTCRETPAERLATRE